MTSATDDESAAPAERPRIGPTRYPVRVANDGDFDLDEILALPGTNPARRLTDDLHLPSALNALGIDVRRTPTPGHHGTEQDAARLSAVDEALLRSIETSGIFQPPVRERLPELTPKAGRAWLALAARWIDHATNHGDLRYLNTACKLLGAVWLLHQSWGSDSSNASDTGWPHPDLNAQLAAVGRLLGNATAQLHQRLSQRRVPPNHGPYIAPAAPQAPVPADPPLARIMVLAGAGSTSATRLATDAIHAGVQIEAICWYAPPADRVSQPSSYTDAWYPPSTTPAPASTTRESALAQVPTISATRWDQVVGALHKVRADLVLLASMPIVPARVLETARLGVLNAHNGALPSYRGMDAVGWALLNDDPIVCTLHLARPAVDAGEILASHAIPLEPVQTLRARVKSAQLQLLVSSAAYVAATGQLPDTTPQPPHGRHFYRLHPHMKRVLDTSPYAKPPNLLQHQPTETTTT